MQNVASLASVAAAVLLVGQAALVLLRTPSCLRRHVPALLSVGLLLLAAHASAPAGSAAAEAELAGLLWSLESFLLLSSGQRGLRAWTGAAVAVVVTLLIGRALRYEASAQYLALRAFSFLCLGGIVLGTVHGLWKERRAPAALAALAAGCLWALVGGTRAALSIAQVPFNLPAFPQLALSLCTAWIVFQDGYPARPAWNGCLPALAAREGFDESAYQRLFQAENALAAQEKTMAAGFLALGAAHEFKNTLSLVRLAASHGLLKPDGDTKDACLRQIVEHTRTAHDSAVEVLERLAADGAGEPQRLDAQRDLTAVIRRAGAALRGQGLVIDLDLGCGVPFLARRSDVEQILLNLIRNAADGYGRRPSEARRPLAITARAVDDTVVIEVRDRAGGVEDAARPLLFTASAPGAGRSGLGLYLSKSLAIANGGGLDYVPVEGGSAFRLVLPAAE